MLDDLAKRRPAPPGESRWRKLARTFHESCRSLSKQRLLLSFCIAEKGPPNLGTLVAQLRKVPIALQVNGPGSERELNPFLVKSLLDREIHLLHTSEVILIVIILPPMDFENFQRRIGKLVES